MPIGAARISFLALTATVAAEAEVIRYKKGIKGMNGADIDTAQSNFGGSSLGLDGTNDHLRVTAEIDYSQGWTVECWFYTGSTATQNLIVKTTSSEGTEGDLAYNIRLNSGKVQYYLSSNGSSWDIVSGGSSTNSYTTSAWNHVAVSWDGSNYYMFLNGVQERSDASSTQVYDGGFDQIYVGGAEGSSSYLSGYVDEVRFSSVCRYTVGGFSKFQHSPFVNDDDTVFLAHFDNTNGVTRFFDDNGYRQSNYTSDDNASNLKLAVPFDSVNEANDVAHNITGTGLSSAAAHTQGTSATISGGPYWGAYNSAEINSQDGAALVYTMPSSFGSAASATYCVELWARADSATTNGNWALSSADSGARWLFGINTTSSSAFGGENKLGLGDSDWHHIAIVCDSGTKRVYIDAKYEGAWQSNNTGFTDLHVGQFNNTDTNDFDGQIQDLRVYIGDNNGYTGTSTTTKNFQLPPPILEITGEKVGLVGQGDAKVDTSRAKFGSGSLVLDGTGDYVVAHYDSTYIGTGAFTFECFFNIDTDPNNNTVAILSTRNAGGVSGNIQMLYRNLDQKVQVNGYGGSSAFNANGVGSALSLDTWHHYVFARDDSNNVAVFVNGTRVSSGTWDAHLVADGNTLGIGAHANGGIPFNSGAKGWIDEVRVSASDIYGVSNTSITVPTAPFTPDTNDRVLAHFDNSLYSNCFTADNGRGRAMVTATQYGDANIDDTYFKFGTSALDLDGNDCIRFEDWGDFGTGDWTIEGWVYPTTITNATYDAIFTLNSDADWNENADNSAYKQGIVFSVGSFHVATDNSSPPTAAVETFSTGFSTGSWQHFAMVRNGTSVKAYRNGSEIASTTIDSGTNFTLGDNQSAIGVFDRIDYTSAGGTPGSGRLFLTGYVDEFRISSTARYTAAFTAPTEQFQNDENTMVLFHFDGTDGQDVFFDDNGTYS